MDWQNLILLFIAIILIINLLYSRKNKSNTVTVELCLKSFEKNEYDTPELFAICTKNCILGFLPEKGMEFDAAGIGASSIHRVIVSDTYFPKIVCELYLSQSDGDFENALRVLREEKWRIKNN
jgi:hypothetical protein